MKIDWLTFSLPYDGDLWGGLPQHEAFQFKISSKTILNPRYKHSYRMACGAIYSIPKDGDWSQKRLIEMQGQHCQRARELGLTDDAALYHVVVNGGQCSRLDCAFDTDNPCAKVSDVWSAWQNNEIKTKLREASLQSKQGRKGEPANSVYFGSKTSDQRLVIYDKAKQMKLLEKAWVRVELRLYGSAAYRMAKDSLMSDIGTCSRQKVRNMVRTKIGWFEEMMSGQDVDLTPLKYESDVLRWLKTQVAPAIDALPEKEPEIIGEVVNWLYGRLNVIMPGWDTFK